MKLMNNNFSRLLKFRFTRLVENVFWSQVASRIINYLAWKEITSFDFEQFERHENTYFALFS